MLSVVAVGQRSEREAFRCRLQTMLLLQSSKIRPGRRVFNFAAEKLQGGKLRKSCVKGLWSVVLLAESAAFGGVEGQQRCVVLPPGAP